MGILVLFEWSGHMELDMTQLIPEPTFMEFMWEGRLVLSATTKKVISETDLREKICQYDSFEFSEICWETCPSRIYNETGLYTYSGYNNISKAWVVWNVLQEWNDELQCSY